jgi:hypothetical protein
MHGVERSLLLAAIIYMTIYIAFLAVFVPCYLLPLQPHDYDPQIMLIFPLHFLAMLLNLVALVLTIRDLYLRSFPKENTKLTWLLLILMTGGIGWLVYVFKYALRARDSSGAV